MYTGSMIVPPAMAQSIRVDNTFSTTISTPDSQNFTINAGDRVGDNLFHSFDAFSVPTGGSAVFVNPADITNLVTRVTGSSVSNIDGLIQANGSANLFLLNPNGIVFGPDARLDIGGSFLGSTAQSLVFSDGSQLSATDTDTPPALTISAPIGLQMGQNPAEIQVNGPGNTLGSAIPTLRDSTNTGLALDSGQTLALVGGDLNLTGGILTAANGRIELGSVSGGLVSFGSHPSGLILGYDDVTGFRDITLSQGAMADAGGFLVGGIQVQGRNIGLRDSAVIITQNLGLQAAEAIEISAAETLSITQSSPTREIVTTLRSETVGLGQASNIDINAQNVILQGGGVLGSASLSSAATGAITVSADDLVQISGSSSATHSRTITLSAIASASAGSGDISDIDIASARLQIREGGQISSLTYRDGEGANMTIRASESVEVSGSSALSGTESLISTTTLGSRTAGNVQIDTAAMGG